MFKKSLSIVSLLTCLTIVLCSCGSDKGGDIYFDDETSSVVSSQSDKFINNLTGEYEFEDASKSDLRPVAVMINNINIAQKVQTGLSDASIIYETLAEGGITRMLAVYKDLSNTERIGSLRSARYSFVDLACGHDALYVNVGYDPTYCKPHMDELNLDNFDMIKGYSSKYNFRVKNGLATEHTLFTTGVLLTEGFKNNNRRTTAKEAYNKNWQNFVEGSKLNGQPADNVSVFFSASYITNFAYDADTGKYFKSNRSTPSVDNITNEQYSYKNILVLFTNISTFPDNYRVYEELKGGDGYYISNGEYKKIKWTKGSAKDALKITNVDGSKVDYVPGNSYVCITDVDNKDKTTIS